MCVAFAVPVAAFVRLPDRVGTGDPVPALLPVGLGVTGTHAPHVSPGNPGAPGVDAAGTYPGAQVPE